MLKLKLLYFGHLAQTANSLEKCPVLGKTEGRRRRGCSRTRWLDDVTDAMHMKSNKLWEMVRTGRPGVLQPMGSQRVRHNWATEQWHVCVLLNQFTMHMTRYKSIIFHQKNFKKKPVRDAYNLSWNISWVFEEKSDFLIIFDLVQYFKGICRLRVETQSVSLHLIC